MKMLSQYFVSGMLTILIACGSTVFAHDLVEVRMISPDIKIELRYATDQNFTNQKIYSVEKCYLLKPVAEALHCVQQELALSGLGLKIWDAYRPLSAQRKLWKIVPDPRYVADPREGGRHTRGTAVDVTLVLLSNGKELLMPTEFDDFTDQAWRSCDNLPDQVKKNRQILQDVMEKNDFTGLPSEWWHFDYCDWRQCEVLDVDLNCVK